MELTQVRAPSLKSTAWLLDLGSFDRGRDRAAADEIVDVLGVRCETALEFPPKLGIIPFSQKLSSVFLLGAPNEALVGGITKHEWSACLIPCFDGLAVGGLVHAGRQVP